MHATKTLAPFFLFHLAISKHKIVHILSHMKQSQQREQLSSFSFKPPQSPSICTHFWAKIINKLLKCPFKPTIRRIFITSLVARYMEYFFRLLISVAAFCDIFFSVYPFVFHQYFPEIKHSRENLCLLSAILQDCFRENHISGRKLIWMDASHLPNIGVTDFQHIKVGNILIIVVIAQFVIYLHH